MSRLLALLQSFKEHASRPSIEGPAFSYCYGELLAEIERWVSHLEAMSIAKGCVIGLRADYSLSSASALLALLSYGAVPALIPRDRPVAEYLKYSQASGLLDIQPDGTYDYTDIGRPAATHHLLEELRSRREAGLVVFTSGSTGLPKATLHSMERFLLKFDRRGRSLRTLAFLLFDHIAGLDTFFYTLRNGGALILTPGRDPDTILQLIASRKVEVLPTSPSFLRLVCAAPPAPHLDLSSLRIVTYGSEPMDPVTLQRISERFPAVQVLQKYGTTETGSPQTVSRPDNTLWLKFKGDAPQAKVVDGILWLRSEGTMLGYINVPSPEIADGWYCTGDLVEVDGEWLRFLGRADDIIKVGGEKVSPSEVERVVRELEFVKDAFVWGEAHPLMGQVVAAQVAVTTVAPALCDVAAAVRQYCRRRLSPHHAPVRVTVVPDGAAAQLLGYRLKVRRPQSAQPNPNDCS